MEDRPAIASGRGRSRGGLVAVTLAGRAGSGWTDAGMVSAFPVSAPVSHNVEGLDAARGPRHTGAGVLREPDGRAAVFHARSSYNAGSSLGRGCLVQWGDVVVAGKRRAPCRI